MPSDVPAVYWDSCCFIGRIMREPDKISDLESLTQLAEKDKLLIVTSTLTIVEVFQDPSPEAATEDGFRTIKEFFEHPWVVLRAPDRKTMEIAARIRLDFGVKAAAD